MAVFLWYSSFFVILCNISEEPGQIESKMVYLSWEFKAVSSKSERKRNNFLWKRLWQVQISVSRIVREHEFQVQLQVGIKKSYNIAITFSKYIYSVEFRFCQPRNRFQHCYLSFSSAMAIQVSFRLVHRKLFPSSLLKLIHITISLTIANGMTEGNFFCKLTIFLCLKL